jgi:hypothetical protein
VDGRLFFSTELNNVARIVRLLALAFLRTGPGQDSRYWVFWHIVLLFEDSTAINGASVVLCVRYEASKVNPRIPPVPVASAVGENGLISYPKIAKSVVPRVEHPCTRYDSASNEDRYSIEDAERSNDRVEPVVVGW